MKYAPGVLLGNFSGTYVSYKITRVEGDLIYITPYQGDGTEFFHDRAFIRRWYRVVKVDKTPQKFMEMFL